MTVFLRERGVRGVVLDIEGTTTPVSFVYDVLFPYARSHLRDYLAAEIDAPALRPVIQGLRAERAADAAQGHFDEPASPEPTAGLAAYVEWLMDQDAKSPALKLLQGKIWERGYRDGTLRGAVFPDVPDALQHWHAAGIAVAIYSSGSVLAQQLLFSTAPFGDLTPFIGHFFDTGVGPKRSPESYARISQVMGFRGGHLLFLSDVAAELAAARRAGFQTALCIRPGNAEQEGSGELVVRSFEEVVV